MSPLLRHLGSDSLLLLYTALLCERRVVVTARDPGLASACVMAALRLLAPFEWKHILIPSVTANVLVYCCAPAPLLVGVPDASLDALLELEVGEVSHRPSSRLVLPAHYTVGSS